MSDLDNALKVLSATRVPSMLEQKNDRLRVAMETTFKKIIGDLLAVSDDKEQTVRWIRHCAENIMRDQHWSDDDEAEANGENGHG